MIINLTSSKELWDNSAPTLKERHFQNGVYFSRKQLKADSLPHGSADGQLPT